MMTLTLKELEAINTVLAESDMDIPISMKTKLKTIIGSMEKEEGKGKLYSHIAIQLNSNPVPIRFIKTNNKVVGFDYGYEV